MAWTPRATRCLQPAAERRRAPARRRGGSAVAGRDTALPVRRELAISASAGAWTSRRRRLGRRGGPRLAQRRDRTGHAAPQRALVVAEPAPAHRRCLGLACLRGSQLGLGGAWPSRRLLAAGFAAATGSALGLGRRDLAGRYPDSGRTPASPAAAAAAARRLPPGSMPFGTSMTKRPGWRSRPEMRPASSPAPK